MRATWQVRHDGVAIAAAGGVRPCAESAHWTRMFGPTTPVWQLPQTSERMGTEIRRGSLSCSEPGPWQFSHCTFARAAVAGKSAENCAKVVAANTGKTPRQVMRAMISRTTLDPDDGLKWGLVHEVRQELFPVGAEVISIP